MCARASLALIDLLQSAQANAERILAHGAMERHDALVLVAVLRGKAA